MVTPEKTEGKCPRANNHCYTNDFSLLVKFHLLHWSITQMACKYIVTYIFIENIHNSSKLIESKYSSVEQTFKKEQATDTHDDLYI